MSLLVVEAYLNMKLPPIEKRMKRERERERECKKKEGEIYNRLKRDRTG